MAGARRRWRGTAGRAAAAFGLAAAAALPAQAGFANGGFEQGLQGWTVSGFFAEGFDHGIDGLAHGGASAFYGGGIGSPGWLSQTVSTVAGEAVVLSLWLAGDGYMPNSFSVLVDGAPLFELSDAAFVSPTYQQLRLFVTPTAATTTFSFALRSDSGAFHLDDVSVSAVPEPASAALLAVGAAALAVFSARRRRTLDR